MPKPIRRKGDPPFDPDKVSVICNPKTSWEYRCGGCGQLRFHPKKTKPKTCGNCGGKKLTVGRPGTLPQDGTVKVKTNKPKPLWKGPGIEGDGISFSLLSNFLECRERFRLKVVEGLVEDEGFNAAIEFGSMWHEAEEAFFNGTDPIKAMSAYAGKLRATYPRAESVDKWFKLGCLLWPIYLKRWKKDKTEKGKKPILAEISFRVPYTLPSGRVVLLRGKWDGFFHFGKTAWLQENKTKGKIDEEGLTKTVHENLQVMTYLISLLTAQEQVKKDPSHVPEGLTKEQAEALAKFPIHGVLYNVIRRPLADQHAQKQRKGRLVWNAAKTKKIRKGAETEDQFFQRVAGDVAKDPERSFMRWKSRVYKADVERFKRECFNPILEGLLDWWEGMEDPFNPWTNPFHWRFPWGVYNSLASGFRGSYFDFMTGGRKDRLTTIQTLFPELE